MMSVSRLFIVMGRLSGSFYSPNRLCQFMGRHVNKVPECIKILLNYKVLKQNIQIYWEDIFLSAIFQYTTLQTK